MISRIQAMLMAARNRSRVARILREIDAPREQAIKEARLCAEQYREIALREGMGHSVIGTAKRIKGRYLA